MNCPHCNNTGTATVVKTIKIAGRPIQAEYGVTCICKDGIFKRDLKHPDNLVLNEKEQEIYNRLKSGEDIKKVCPF